MQKKTSTGVMNIFLKNFTEVGYKIMQKRLGF